MLRASAVVVGMLLVNAGAWTAEPPAPGLLGRMDATMVGIGAQVRNSEMRIQRGLRSMSEEKGGAPAQYESLAVECCLTNLEQIKSKMLEVQGLMEETRRHYTAQQNQTALGLLDQMETRLRQLAEATMSFVRAPDEDRAKNALLGATRPWNEFRNGIEALERCCAISADPGVQLAPTPPPETFGRGPVD